VTRVLQRWCLMLLLGFAGMALTHPAIAKGGHGHGSWDGHGKRDGKSAGKTDGKTTASKSAPGKGIKTAPHTPAEPGGAASKGDTNPPPSEAPLGKDTNKFPDKVPGTNDAGVKPKVPQISHNPPVTAPANTVTRNAIGMPVTIHEPASSSMLGAGGEHVPNAPGNAAVGPGAKPTGFPLQHPTPVATAGLAASGKIGGTNLIRPAQAPAALGGPAKPSGGINGSTMRLKP
jgi:hypothetical protein